MGIDLKSLNPDYEDRYIAAQDLDWIARILWCSQ
jgi:phage repressor protein C with HTH and peptisase S24 domain